MRHLTEQLLQPLLRILDEYEAGLRALPKKSLRDRGRLCDVARVRLALSKKHLPKRKEHV